MRRAAVVVLMVVLLVPWVSPPAWGQFIVHDPIAFVQMLVDYLQMLADYYRQYQILTGEYRQIEQLAEQYEAMLRNLEELKDGARDNPERFLGRLRDVFFRLEGVVYSADDVLRRYDEVYDPEVTGELSRREDERLRATMTTFRTLMAGAEQHARASEGAAGKLRRLMDQLEAAGGNLEALQALGALTTEVATETTRVSEVQALAVNALVVREANDLAREEEARLTLLDWMDRASFYRGGPAPRSFDPVPSAFRRASP